VAPVNVARILVLIPKEHEFRRARAADDDHRVVDLGDLLLSIQTDRAKRVYARWHRARGNGARAHLEKVFLQDGEGCRQMDARAPIGSREL